MDVAVKCSVKNHAVGSYKNLFICNWRNETTQKAYDGVEAELDRLLGSSTSKVNLIFVIDNSAAPPPTNIRKHVGAYVRRIAPKVASGIYIHLGEGMSGIITRSVFAMVQTLSGKPFPMEVHSSIDSGARWINKFVPFISQREITAAINSVRDAPDDV